MAYEIFQSEKTGEYHFRLKAKNGEIILASEGYLAKAAAENGIASVVKNAQDEDKFERREAKNGQYYFVLKAGNGQVIGVSEMYKSGSGMEKGIKSVMKNAKEKTKALALK